MAVAVAEAACAVTAAGIATTGIAALVMRRIIVNRRRVNVEHAAAFVSGDTHHHDDTINHFRRFDFRITSRGKGHSEAA